MVLSFPMALRRRWRDLARGARRDTRPHPARPRRREPFADRLRELIALEGPITVERYMSLCLQHYYATRDPLGAAGDFTTAPEISQMFGELIGLWMLEVWHAMGRPAPVRLVELGPGRGTLMADACARPGSCPISCAASVHLVETSPALRERQRARLAASRRSDQPGTTASPTSRPGRPCS